MVANPYFQLTSEFNSNRRNVILASGQAVVYYRLAIMSKDGDWVVRETEEACRQVRKVLASHGARYRAGAPLDPRWLSGGWSSHFEFVDDKARRIRCDFFSRPPRIPKKKIDEFFDAQERDAVIDVESLIRMKQTQRAKDYPVIGELARLLPPRDELDFTTDPDRILDLSPAHGDGSSRASVHAALESGRRIEVVKALAVELDEMQREDRLRVERHSRAAESYLRAISRLDKRDLELPDGHRRLCELAEELLPTSVDDEAEP